MPRELELKADEGRSGQRELTVYYLVWRSRPSHPWRSEEVYTRFEAHKKYLSLVQRGLEVYLERRQRAMLPA